MYRPDRPKVGLAQGCEDARAIVNTLTLACRRCGALVDWRCAKTHARRAKRTGLAKNAGCAGKGCTKQFKPTKFKDTQMRMAAKLLNGGRVLAAWPKDVEDTEVWLHSQTVIDAAVAKAKAMNR